MESLAAHMPTGLSTGNELSKAFKNWKRDMAAIHVLASTQ